MLNLEKSLQSSPINRSFDTDRLDVTAGQVQQKERPPRHALQRPRIDDARFADAMLLGDVRVAVEEEIEGVGVFEFVQQMPIVAVRERQ